MARITMSEQDKIDILARYNNGESVLSISKSFPYSYDVIHYFLKKNGIEIRSNKYNSRKYHCNSNIFSEIDTEEKAYWLGFLYADGCIMKSDYNAYIVSLALGLKDREHLRKFQSFLNTNYPIHDYMSTGNTHHPYSRIAIRDNKIALDLINHGVFLRKTEDLKFPLDLPNNLMSHFIRGYFDGDGCLTGHLDKNKHMRWYLKFCGTMDMMNGIQNHILHFKLYNKPVALTKRYKNNVNNYNLEIGGNKQVGEILNYIYRDATIYLERKYQKYLTMIENKGEQTK